MRTRALAVAVAVSMIALASAARAADVAPAPSTYDWSGVYVGLNAGAAWGNTELNSGIDCRVTGSGACDGDPDWYRQQLDDNGAVFTGGAMIGANWQHDSLVLGVEADVNYADFGVSNSREVSEPFGTIFTKAEIDGNWWGTVRGRLGFAADNFLFYGTGGLAWGTLDASARVDQCQAGDCANGFTAKGSDSSTNIGWTAGAGMEYGLDHWTLGVEYLYVDLGEADFDHDVTANGSYVIDGFSLSGHADVDYQFSVVRATAKWRF